MNKDLEVGSLEDFKDNPKYDSSQNLESDSAQNTNDIKADFDNDSYKDAYKDRVKGYFAFRKINVVNGRILLNNRPYTMKMLLDQGYFRKGLLTAPTDDDLRKDIEYTKSMGFFPGGHALFARGYEYHGEPVMVTEFGGISYCKDGTEGWGYTAAGDEEDFLRRFRDVVEPLLKSENVQGFVYTQLTDVEQEINGLMTYDREFKVSPDKIREIVNGQ